MPSIKRIAIALFCFANLLWSTRAMANLVDFTFTGTGANGSQAVGTFTTEGNLAPFYFATGSIYSAFSLTITGVPGSGPSSVGFDLTEMQSSWLIVDGSGTIFIAPYGSHNFGAPFFNHYDLGQPSQPNYPGSFTYVTDLTYNGRYVDTITWSAATVASPAVSDGGSTLAMLAGAAITLAAGLRRRKAG